MISTHAPLAGRDDQTVRLWAEENNFNPRAPCGARHGVLHAERRQEDFNPRAPCGARHGFLVTNAEKRVFQPTRPLRGATYTLHDNCTHTAYFNPRAPCGARLTSLRTMFHSNANFNPRAPCGARPNRVLNPSNSSNISTHAPLAGRDHETYTETCQNLLFQPTRPLRGATIGKEGSSYQ